MAKLLDLINWFITSYSICKSFNESSLRPISKVKLKNSVILMILCRVTDKIGFCSAGQLNSELIFDRFAVILQ